MRKLLATLALTLGFLNPAGAVTFEPQTARVLRVRRVFPDLVREAAAQGIDLTQTMQDGHFARRAAGAPAPRAYQTIVIEPAPRLPVPIAPAPAAAVRDLERRLRPFAGVFAGDAATRRARLAERLRALAAAGDRDAVTDLVRFALWSMDVTDVDSRLDHLDERDLELFSTPRFLKARLGRLKAEFGASRRRDRAVVNLLGRVHRSLRLAGAPARSPTRLVLSELHPELAAYKGYLGRDCSTRFCFGIPFAPGERVFVILDHRERPRGYVGLTRTEVDGRGTYYVNTVNGRRLSPEHTLMVIAGVRALLDDEVSQISLPRPSQLKAAINFRGVRGMLRGLVEHEADVAQTFPDAAVRAAVEFHGHASYESMVDNRVARVVPPATLARFQFPTTVFAGSRFAALDPTEPTPLEFNAAVVEAICAHQTSFADAIWHRAGGTTARFEQIRRILTNARFESVARHRARVAPLLRELGLPDSTLDADPDPFTPARIVAAGSMSARARPGTIATLLIHLGERAGWPAGTPLEAWLAALAPDAREDLILATTRALYAAADRRAADHDQFRVARQSQFTTLLARLTTRDELVARAPALVARGLAWGELVEATVHLGAFEDDTAMIFAGRPSLEFANAIVAGAPTAAELAHRARQVLTAPSGAGFHDQVGKWLARFVALNPSAADVDALVGGVREPATTRALIGWLGEPPPRDLPELLRTLARHFTRPLDAYDRALVTPHLAARFDVILQNRPAAADLLTFRETYLNETSGLHALLVARAETCAERLGVAR